MVVVLASGGMDSAVLSMASGKRYGLARSFSAGMRSLSIARVESKAEADQAFTHQGGVYEVPLTTLHASEMQAEPGAAGPRVVFDFEC